MRRGLRRPYRLVRVGVHSSCLNVSTGMRVRGTSRAGAHVRAGARDSGPNPLETLRRLAFSLAGGLLAVSRGGFRRDGGGAARMRRGGRRRA